MRFNRGVHVFKWKKWIKQLTKHFVATNNKMYFSYSPPFYFKHFETDK